MLTELLIYCLFFNDFFSDGIKFFLSSNKVILSEGDHEGAIHPKYFQRVMQIRPSNFSCFV